MIGNKTHNNLALATCSQTRGTKFTSIMFAIAPLSIIDLTPIILTLINVQISTLR